MTNWILPPDLQKRYQEIASETKKLQEELGIRPESNQNQKTSVISITPYKIKRPPPNWKV